MTTYNLEIEIEAPLDNVFAREPTRATGNAAYRVLSPESPRGDKRGEALSQHDEDARQTTISEELYTVDEENYRTVSVFEDEDMSGELTWEYTDNNERTHVLVHGEVVSRDSLFDRAIHPDDEGTRRS